MIRCLHDHYNISQKDRETKKSKRLYQSLQPFILQLN